MSVIQYDTVPFKSYIYVQNGRIVYVWCNDELNMKIENLIIENLFKNDNKLALTGKANNILAGNSISPAFILSDNGRKKQVDTLKIFNDNVTVITQNEKYLVEFSSGGNNLNMIVTLPPEFPEERPSLKINPVVAHKWLNDDGEIISAPGYINYSIYSDLGRVVRAIIREFQKNPPLLRKAPPIAPPIATDEFSYKLPELSPGNSEHGDDGGDLDNMEYAMRHLRKMSVQDLKLLNDHDDCLEDFVRNLPGIRSLKNTLIDMIDGTEDIADKNLKYEASLKEFESEIRLEQSSLCGMKEKCDVLYSQYQMLKEMRSPSNIAKILKKMMVKLDDQSDRLTENFLNGSIPIDEFVVKYKDIQMKVHCYKMKANGLLAKK